MAGNTLLSISWITNEAAMILKNKLKFGNSVNRQYDNRFAQTGAKVGNSINIRKPIRPVGRVGMVAQYDDINETYVSLTLDHPFGVDLNYTTIDLTLSMDDFSRRYIAPAVARIANYVDEVGLQLYNQFSWMVGTPGTIPNTNLIYTTAGAILTEEATPDDDDLRSMILNPMSMATIQDANKALFNPAPTISEEYRSAKMPETTKALGWRWMGDSNVIPHTVGPLGGTPLVNGANQTGANLVTDGWTASAANRLKQGDIFTVANVYAVNPMNRRNTGRLRQFVVTGDVNSDGSGNATIPISPSLVGPTTATAANPLGITQFQTVNALPADNAPLTVVGAANTVSMQNLGIYRDAVVLGMADLDYPRGAVRAERVSDPDSAISIRVVEYYDGR